MPKIQKIISLVPSQTELLFDLGLQDSIVGVTKFCVHPKNAKKTKIVVGGTKNVKIDKIKNLKPDIILCNKEENTKEIVEQCLEVAPTHVSDIYTIRDALDLIHSYGEIFNCSVLAQEIIDKIRHQQDQFLQFIKDKPKLKVAYFIWKEPWMVAANNTYIHSMLELTGFINVFSDHSRYPEIHWNELEEKQPECIFLSSEPYPFKEQHIHQLSEKFPNTKTLVVDGEMFSWYGSRLIKAFNYFKELHQSIAAFSI